MKNTIMAFLATGLIIAPVFGKTIPTNKPCIGYQQISADSFNWVNAILKNDQDIPAPPAKPLPPPAAAKSSIAPPRAPKASSEPQEIRAPKPPRPPHKPDNRINEVVNDLMKEGVIAKRENLKSFKLSQDEFIVNGKKQSDEIFRKFKEKYANAAGRSNWIWSFNYDFNKNGKTITETKTTTETTEK